MTITRTNKIYRVNGLLIGGKTLQTIAHEIFNADGWQKLERRLAKSGVVNIEFYKPNEVTNDLHEALNDATRKIAALEKRVAELTIENIYLNA